LFQKSSSRENILNCSSRPVACAHPNGHDRFGPRLAALSSAFTVSFGG
jgi:hypothetical protein